VYVNCQPNQVIQKNKKNINGCLKCNQPSTQNKFKNQQLLATTTSIMSFSSQLQSNIKHVDYDEDCETSPKLYSTKLREGEKDLTANTDT